MTIIGAAKMIGNLNLNYLTAFGMLAMASHASINFKSNSGDSHQLTKITDYYPSSSSTLSQLKSVI